MAETINIFDSTFYEIRDGRAASSGPPEILSQRVAWNTLHNSGDRSDPPSCHPGTRTAVLKSIGQWATGKGKPILWLHGGIGAGKSAIAQTTAEDLQKQGALGAGFFFRRDLAGLNANDFLVPTLAYQLFTTFPAVRSHICDAILQDPNIFKKSLKDQFHNLIASPIRAEQDALPLIVIIIDGLDEWSSNPPIGLDNHETQQRLILEAIEYICHISPSLPLQFLISSRPEPQIRTCFRKTSLRELTLEVSLNHEPNAVSDISLFLKDKFAEIRERHSFLDSSWPSANLIQQIIENSSDHFIYPSTIVRHLLSLRVDPEQSLNEMLRITARTTHAEPFATLDGLYNQIIESVALESRPIAIDILQLVLDVGGGLGRSHAAMIGDKTQHLTSVKCIAKIFSTTPSHIHTTLVDLHSILDIPQPSSSAPITFIHASLHDFLTDRERSRSFYVGGRMRLRLQVLLLRYIDKLFWQLDLDVVINFLAHVLFFQGRTLLDLALEQDTASKIGPLVISQIRQLRRAKSAERSGLCGVIEIFAMHDIYEMHSPINWIRGCLKRNTLFFKLLNLILRHNSSQLR